MNLCINPSGGMAGDMFCAALISAGADVEKMIQAMTAAGNKLGSAHIEHHITEDGSSQLAITLESAHKHLPGKKGKQILTELFDAFDIKKKYRVFGFKVLDILIKAEKRAHKEFNIIMNGDHHGHSHSHDHDHSHGHSHDADDALLHEAQDIVIDIMGAVTGLQLLDIEPKAGLTGPICVGGGQVTFSHGTLDVPAPATFIILEKYRLPWQKGPIEKELFTPTGATILAALDAKLSDKPQSPIATGKSRGTKILPIPPLEIYVY
jgi:uncharacterized protein (DUF111 family)